MDEVARLLSSLPSPAHDGVFLVLKVTSAAGYYVGRTKSGHACLLICTTGTDRPTPVRLAGLEAVFGIECELAEPGEAARVETLTVLQCLSTDPQVQQFFAIAAEGMIETLGETPRSLDVAAAFSNLVELFQKLRPPAQRTLSGLVGELVFIYCSVDPVAAIRSWRVETQERFDFASGRMRVDAKASSSRRRLHSVSFDQANPPPDVTAIFASLFVEQTAGGMSLRELLQGVEAKARSDRPSISKLMLVAADTLGRDLPEALKWRFDFPLAVSSLRFYSATDVPALRPPLPTGVSGVRFTADFDQATSASVSALRSVFNAGEAALLPPS